MAKIKRNGKEQEIRREEKKESAALPPSAAEQLNKVKLILAMNGYNVEDLAPQKREYNSPMFSKPEIYTSPIEFSVNGIIFGLYGTRLTVNGTPDKTYTNIYDVPATYKLVTKIIANNSQVKIKPPEPKKSLAMARYVAACVE
jgi:hypothetical protein